MRPVATQSGESSCDGASFVILRTSSARDPGSDGGWLGPMMRTPGLLMLMAVSAMIASCSAAPGTGPLANTDPGFSIGICSPAGVGESVSFGPANWINPTAEPLTIDYLGLVDPDGVELVGAFVVPNPGDGHGGGAGIGASHGFPPEPYEGDTLSWDEQQSLPGAVLPHRSRWTW